MPPPNSDLTSFERDETVILMIKHGNNISVDTRNVHDRIMN